MKFLIVNAFGRSNRGDSVLLDECIRDIRQFDSAAVIAVAVYEGAAEARNLYPEIKWSGRIGNAPGKPRTLWYLILSWLFCITRWPVFSRLLPVDQQETLAELLAADVVISAPGGYLHDSNFAYIVALHHIHLGDLLGKPVVLAPQSYGPVNGFLARAWTRHILQKAVKICAREQYSFDFLSSTLRLDSDIIARTGDSAFWNMEATTKKDEVDAQFLRLGISTAAPILGLTVVNWHFPGLSPAERLKSSYVKALTEIVEAVSGQFGLQPVIFNQVSEDLPLALEVQRLAKVHIAVDQMEHEPGVLRGMIGRSTVFLGTRFHSCIFAIMAGRPVFSIAYLPKTSSIMADLGLADRYCHIEAVEVERIVEQISFDVSNLVESQDRISDAVVQYRKKFGNFSDVLSTIPDLNQLRSGAVTPC
ncbi:hypothetical protein ASD04_00485 [Devosia sp. Root436]|uniref:polysaccharide pyruvyl transferase family protein n=1 Tax=Devosia sp. Root436 TaxID=1736537 RepID=UPI0006F34295|nr:polysaccharide pyruvyl transferase family protein [Devosia sp. Root436]KQX42486.1 hypothetical protein ASD04_00485 [Devosia sp. Root436]